MATTTPNFGWDVPQSTDLVKDGATAIAALGNDIDTSLVDLKGGTTGQVLSKASNTDLDYSWTTISSGGMTLISETTASALSSLSFSSLSGYKEYYLVWSGISHSSASNMFEIRINNDSGSNYDRYFSQTENSSASYGGGASGTSLTNGSRGPLGEDVRSTALWEMSQGYLKFCFADSTTKFKVIKGQWSYYKTGATSYVSIDNYQGVYKSTSAITSIDIFRSTGTGTFSNATNTSIRLYGVN